MIRPLLAVLLAALAAFPAAAQGGSTLWFADLGEGASRWCAYRDERTWRALENAYSAGFVTTHDSGATVVEVMWSSPSGDWQVTDTYAFTPNEFGQMTRKGGDATFETYLDARYRLNGGRAPTLIEADHRRWEGREKPSGPWIRDVPLYGSPSKFPFAKVVEALRQAPDKAQLCL
ncbi:MAG TPA: hypothetical protein VEA44_11755 [Caulobacter sp.]|nr:hypothetical protein [Caulobacter sp.]